MKNLILALAAGAMTVAGCTTADAQYRGYDGYHSQRDYRHYDRRNNYRNNYRYERGRTHAWRGSDGRYRCRRSDGTTGTVVGAIAGGLLGRTIDRSGDRTLGTVLGGVGGAVLGREIDRKDCR